MTDLEKTMLHRERKCRVMGAHQELVASGKYATAWRLFALLLNGRVTLGLSTAAFETAELLHSLGFSPYVSRGGNYETFQI